MRAILDEVLPAPHLETNCRELKPCHKGSSWGMLESRTGTGRPLLSEVPINRAAMGDPQCENHEFRVSYRVDNPVVTDPDPP